MRCDPLCFLAIVATTVALPIFGSDVAPKEEAETSGSDAKLMKAECLLIVRLPEDGLRTR